MPLKSINSALWFSFALFLSGGCASNAYYDASKAHHTPEGFKNNYANPPHEGFWRWKWDQFWDDLPKPPEGGYEQFKVIKPSEEDLRANPAITWLGHATLLLRVAGVTVLTDPHLTERASPLSWAGPKRRVPPALTIAQLPHIDAVVISHNHYDHLDRETVEGLNAQAGGPPRFFVPLGLKAWFNDLGIENVVELDWWDRRDYKGISLHFTPTQHFSARTPFDRNETLWGSWVVTTPDFRFYFAGDTGYSADFKDIGRRLGPFDLAAIPIGAYEPRWFMEGVHVNPAEAVMIHQDLRARRSLGMHWGTFELTDEPMDEPPRKLTGELAAAGISTDTFYLMQHGETRRLDPAAASSTVARR